MKTLILLCLLGISLGHTINRIHSNIIADPSWQLWKSLHQKSYEHLEAEKIRYQIWRDNLQHIMEHNLAGNTGYTLRMNQFGDLTNVEFRQRMNGYKMRTRNSGSTFLAPSHVELNETVDWRNEGYVTDVKNQAQCGSCWAFSTTGSLEGQHFKKTGKLISLSEQQLVDCDRKSGDQGCNGGLMDKAFEYIKENGGIESEESYSYTGRDGTCHFDSSKLVATVSGFTDVKKGDEDALKQAVGTVGPISVAIDASHMSFQFYSGGVYDPWLCSSTNLDHGVLAVGYGTESKKDYWLVKNSWGNTWGEKGYIKMIRNKNNKCGIATQASYPLV